MSDGLALWSMLLLAGKWLFLGLLYLALAAMFAVVRRELRQGLREEAEAPAGAGRLRVLAAGADSRARPGHEFALPPQATLGADESSTVLLADPYISARHACLTWDGTTWWVEDLGSANGTAVDGRQCQPHVKCRVPYGGRLALGDVILELAE